MAIRADVVPVKHKLESLLDELLSHDGYGQIQVDMRILKRGQKEIILRCGKEYRYVVNFQIANG
ncbi:hypothetical protein [uncultured Desulfuromonas sp.]|uniref:hypothetical protein n=1 Tax=uncultured Desulfuromonas sp. TaxID=181013 RepID=UPI002AAB5CCF|nr:hypothetical protein [uncultured Desulfuromonas sp.]